MKTVISEGGIVEDLCTPDVVSPAQFQDLWAGTAERSAEFKLALAVLEQALADLAKHHGARATDARRLYRHAYTWLLSNDRHWAYSFVNVCEMLNISADRVRAYVVAAHGRGAEGADASPAGEGARTDGGGAAEGLATVACRGNA